MYPRDEFNGHGDDIPSHLFVLEFFRPLAIFPQVAGIPNSTGTPPAAQIPSFTASVIWRRCADPGEPAMYESGTPICGFLLISLSEYPAAFIITRLWAASAPFQYSVLIVLLLV